MDYETPKLTVDAVIADEGRIVLIRRANPPFKGKWALPGGFVDVGETVQSACEREVFEETGLKVKVKELVGLYSDPKRDPRGHTASAAYICRVLEGQPRAGDDASFAAWHDMLSVPPLAFDHDIIVRDALRLIKGGL